MDAMRLVFWMALDGGLLEDDKKEDKKGDKEVTQLNRAKILLCFRNLKAHVKNKVESVHVYMYICTQIIHLYLYMYI